MKAPLRGKVEIVPTDWPDSAKQEFLASGEPRYCWFKLEHPLQQDGQDFSYAVVPFKFNDKLVLEQTGAGVICQTEAEAKESFHNLNERSKKHLVSFHCPGYGNLGWMSNLRRLANEIGVLSKTLAEGKILWLAFEREIDQDTLETKVIRRRETDDEGEARFWAEKWAEEYNQEKKSYFDSIGKSITPPPPPRCTSLTNADIGDVGKAKMVALQKQWPNCFAIFARQKSSPHQTIPLQEIEDAYLLDLVQHGGSLWNGTGGKIRADMSLISALHRAGENYAKRGKSKIIDAAIYLIAFNWELGWCYLSDEELAEKLGKILDTAFTSGQVKQYRYRTLGLVAKHLPGASPKAS